MAHTGRPLRNCRDMNDTNERTFESEILIRLASFIDSFIKLVDFYIYELGYDNRA